VKTNIFFSKNDQKTEICDNILKYISKRSVG